MNHKESLAQNIKSRLTLHFTNFLIDLMVASQKAPLNFALTGVSTCRNAGTSLAYEKDVGSHLNHNVEL